MILVTLNDDVIDMDEHRISLRCEGTYAGANGLITKPAISIAPAAAFLNIIATFGYNQKLAKGMQSGNAQTGMWSAVVSQEDKHGPAVSRNG